MAYIVVGVSLVVVGRVIAGLIKRVDEPKVVKSQHVTSNIDLSTLLERRQLVVSQVLDARQHRLERGFEACSKHLVIWFGTKHHAVLALVSRHRDHAHI